MSSVTEILSSIENGGPLTSDRLLPLVYDQLRRLAARQLSHERPGQTLDATALVHEAFLRLVDSAIQTHWDSRKHFFAAASESMRRILVENARHKKTLKRGGALIRRELNEAEILSDQPSDEILDLDEALKKLERVDSIKVELVKLRYFCGFSNAEASELLGVSEKTGERYWAFARAWLFREIRNGEPAMVTTTDETAASLRDTDVV